MALIYFTWREKVLDIGRNAPLPWAWILSRSSCFTGCRWPPSPSPQFHREDTRLKKIEVASTDLIVLLDPRESYRLLGHDGKLIRMADSRHAQVLATRQLIVGTVNGAGVLHSLKLAPGKTAAQVKNVMRLKPAAQSICNRATVVKVLPTTYTHRSSLAAGL